MSQVCRRHMSTRLYLGQLSPKLNYRGVALFCSSPLVSDSSKHIEGISRISSQKYCRHLSRQYTIHHSGIGRHTTQKVKPPSKGESGGNIDIQFSDL